MNSSTYQAGRHFLQIPGPTNVPDRILRAMDHPTIDHRGPAFAELGRKCLDGMKTVFKTDTALVSRETSLFPSLSHLIDSFERVEIVWSVHIYQFRFDRWWKRGTCTSRVLCEKLRGVASFFNSFFHKGFSFRLKE